MRGLDYPPLYLFLPRLTAIHTVPDFKVCHQEHGRASGCMGVRLRVCAVLGLFLPTELAYSSLVPFIWREMSRTEGRAFDLLVGRSHFWFLVGKATGAPPSGHLRLCSIRDGPICSANIPSDIQNHKETAECPSSKCQDGTLLQ